MQKRIELPRSLESYFAFAEGERGRDGRRFSITLSYLDHGRMDKLQWWWRISAAEESLLGADGCEVRRLKEIERFQRHVERWLANHGRSLYGSGPFPCLGSLASSGDLGVDTPGGTGATAPGSAGSSVGGALAGPHADPPHDKVANG